ncbi:hypothetical protein JCM12681A_40940 [Streptomyces mexicanus]
MVGVDKDVPPEDLRDGRWASSSAVRRAAPPGGCGICRPVSDRSAALPAGEAGKSGDSRSSGPVEANGFSGRRPVRRGWRAASRRCPGRFPVASPRGRDPPGVGDALRPRGYGEGGEVGSADRCR